MIHSSLVHLRGRIVDRAKIVRENRHGARKESNMHANKLVIAAGIAGALALAALTPSSAAPMPIATVGLKSAVASDVVDVRHRRGHGRWIAGGIAASLAIGAIAASRPYYYYPYPYYYDYAPPPAVVYGPAPVYVVPSPAPYGPVCWVTTDPDRGYGYWRPC